MNWKGDGLDGGLWDNANMLLKVRKEDKVADNIVSLNAIVTVLLSLNFLIDTPAPQFEELVWRYWYICFIYSNKEM